MVSLDRDCRGVDHRDMKTITRPFLLALLSVFLAVPVTSCATVGPKVDEYAPKIVKGVQTATMALDAIHVFSEGLNLNPDLAKKVAIAEARARSALAAALNIANGAQAITQLDVTTAFTSFAAAYKDLVALLGPLGLGTTGDKFAATPGSGTLLLVPPAEDLIPSG